MNFSPLNGAALNAAPAPAIVATPLDLQEAVVAWLGADAALDAALAGGVHADEAPRGTPLPYLVVSDPDAEWGRESGGGSIEAARIQLSVFAAGKAAGKALRRLAEAALEDAPLAFLDGTLLHLKMAGSTNVLDPDRGPGGRDVWQQVRIFEAVVGRG